MKCQEIRSKIFAYLDDELSPEESQKLYKHLSTCQACSRYLDMARDTHKLLKVSLTHMEPPKSFTEDIMRRITGGDDEAVGAEVISGGDPALNTEAARANKGFFKGNLMKGIFKKGFVAASIAILILTGGVNVMGYGDKLMGDGFFNIGFMPGDREGVSGSRSFSLSDLFNRRGAEKKQNAPKDKEAPKTEKDRAETESKDPAGESQESEADVKNNVEIVLFENQED
ncbi:MAG: hypothetical protein GX318_00830, partial [Clostridia bacterium]|nr:hypothetical protein [Clostridia bacterium]